MPVPAGRRPPRSPRRAGVCCAVREPPLEARRRHEAEAHIPVRAVGEHARDPAPGQRDLAGAYGQDVAGQPEHQLTVQQVEPLVEPGVQAQGQARRAPRARRPR